jgi:hypothetical protein
MEREVLFTSVESALRFYYRAEEILSSKSSLRFHLEGEIPQTNSNPREELMLEFLTVGACLRGLNTLQQWILREIYRPRRSTERQGIIGRVCAAGESRYPRVRWTLQGVGRLRAHALDQLESTMSKKSIVPAHAHGALNEAASKSQKERSH